MGKRKYPKLNEYLTKNRITRNQLADLLQVEKRTLQKYLSESDKLDFFLIRLVSQCLFWREVVQDWGNRNIDVLRENQAKIKRERLIKTYRNK